MATQADWRMMLGIRQQPNQWAQALSNLPVNLMQGLQIGDYFRERGRESQLQELMRGAIDPQTGEVDTGKALGALMQYDPAVGIKLMQQDRIARMQSEGLQAAMQGDYTPEERDILKGYSVAGKIGEGIAKIGELRYGKTTAAENRAQEFIPGVVNTADGPVEVTLSREDWARYRQQQQPSGGTPAPATGQLIGPERPPIAGAPSHNIDLKAIWEMSPEDRAKLYSQLTPGQVADINLALSKYGKVTAQTPFAPPQRNKTAPGVPGIPGGPAVTGLPATAIQRGLSPAQQQQFDIQKEERAKQRQIEEENRKNQAAKTSEEQSQINRVDLQVEKMYTENDYAPTIKAGQAIPAQKAALAVQEKLLDTMNTGPGAEVLLKTKRFFAAFGLSSDKIDADIANAEKLRGAALDNVNSLLSSFNGTQTEGDAQRAIDQYASIDKSVEGNRFLVDYRKAVLDLTQKKVDFYTKARKEVKLPSLVYEAWLASPEAKLSVYDMPSMRKWKERLPENAQAQQGAEKANKVGTQQDVLDVAKKLNISPDAALQRLKAAGWSIQ